MRLVIAVNYCQSNNLLICIFDPANGSDRIRISLRLIARQAKSVTLIKETVYLLDIIFYKPKLEQTLKIFSVLAEFVLWKFLLFWSSEHCLKKKILQNQLIRIGLRLIARQAKSVTLIKETVYRLGFWWISAIYQPQISNSIPYEQGIAT